MTASLLRVAWLLPLGVLAAVPLGCGKSSGGRSGAQSYSISFAAPVTVSSVGAARALAAGDFNQDGKMDLVSVGSDNTLLGSLGFHRNTATTGVLAASFAGVAASATGIDSRAIAAADLNGDGNLDLVVANYGTPLTDPPTPSTQNTVVVFRNKTVPRATAPDFQLTATLPMGDDTNPSAVALADLNGDGKPDLVVTLAKINKLRIYFNGTTPGQDPAFTASSPEYITGANPIAVAIGDLNGDGKPDLVVANAATPTTNGTLTVLLNQTAPGSTTPTFTQSDLTAGATPDSVTIADVNGDGKPDLIVTHFDSNSVTIYLNDMAPGATAPKFKDAISYATESNPWGCVCRDFNGDGKPDIAVANYAAGTIDIYLNTTVAGAASPSFSTPLSIPAGNFPNSVIAGDFNGDGRIDLAAANGDGNITVLLNTTSRPAATPAFATAINAGGGKAPSSIALRDFDGSGSLDFVTADNLDNRVSGRLNDTSPGAATTTFESPEAFNAGTAPLFVATADLNGDGRPDLAIANNGTDNVTVRLNNTPLGGTPLKFEDAATVDLGAGTAPKAVAIADFNGDGKPDLAIVNAGTGTVSILLNATAPGATPPVFTTPAYSIAVGSTPVAIAAADFNLDGRIDVVVVNNGASPPTLSILRNDTTPGSATLSFTALTPISLLAGGNPQSIAVADFNGDGFPDLAVAHQDLNKVSILLNTANDDPTLISFAAATDANSFVTGSQPVYVAIGDFNADGRPDLVVANLGDDTVSVLLNNTAPAPAAAVTLDVGPKADFAVQDQPRAVAVGDLNRDWKADLAVVNANANTVSFLLAQ
jgi:hypothetical protein